VKISYNLIKELIEGSNFNFRSLGGPNLDDLSLFNKYTYSAYKYQKYVDENGEPPFTDQKVMWALKPFDYDEALFEKQILNILNDRPLDEGYTDFSRGQLRDIITCAASIYIRADYSMNFKYTDLPKD
jgi:hypothetical protein